MSRPLLIVLLGALTPLAACIGDAPDAPDASGASAGPDAAAADAYTVRDSAGVRIIEADWDALPVLDTVAAEPAFVLGDDDVPLTMVQSGRILTGGRIAVGYGMEPEVVVADTADGGVTVVATAGEGPAELGGVATLHVEGPERLGVYDPRRRRYLVFDLGTGEPVRTLSLADAWPGQIQRGVRPWGPPAFMPGEGDTFHIAEVGEPPEEIRTGRAELALVRVEGERADTVVTYAGSLFYRDARGFGPVLLGAQAAFAASPDGIWVADTEVPAVARWSGPGAPELIVRWSRDRSRTLTEEHLRSVLDRLMEQFPEPQREMAREYAESLPVPDSLPAYGDVVADDRGVLWVGEHHGVDFPQLRHLPDAPREWALFGPDGAPLGRVLTPPRTNVLDVTADALLAVHQDDLGVETVRLYRLER